MQQNTTWNCNEVYDFDLLLVFGHRNSPFDVVPGFCQQSSTYHELLNGLPVGLFVEIHATIVLGLPTWCLPRQTQLKFGHLTGSARGASEWDIHGYLIS